MSNSHLWLAMLTIMVGGAVLIVDHLVGESVHPASPVVASSFAAVAVAIAKGAK